ncbi:MAG TPA: ABC transporter substrate-binding protein [Burkholderiales bacterium]|nr:ABC transporter substrate-binding protein [Burkholderiales bacterium]
MSNDAKDSIVTHLKFQLNYKFQGQNAPFLHAADAGYFADSGLTCEFLEGVSSSLVTRPIAEGNADLGFGDVSSVLEHSLRTGRTDILCVMPVYERSPCCLAYRGGGGKRAEYGLRLADLRGKTLAGPQGDTSARLLPLLLERNGLAGMPYDLRTVTSEERDRLIAAGEVAAITCFDATLMFSMRSRGYDTGDLRFFYYADNGLDIYSSALLCSRAAAERDPGMLDALIRIVETAWRDCKRDPELGVRAAMARSPSSDAAIVRGQLEWVLEHQAFPKGDEAMRFDVTGPKMQATLDCAVRTVGYRATVSPAGLPDRICVRRAGGS